MNLGFSRKFTGAATQPPEWLQVCSAELEALRKADGDFEVFGASKHRYNALPVSEEEVGIFEAWCGVKLPPGYRDYLIHIGYGAGPYYGLWSPAESRSELEGLLSEWKRELGRTASVSRPFPHSIADAQTARARQGKGDKQPWITSTWPIDGCIPICYHGCTFWTVLVVSGESSGRLWDVANYVGYEGLWLPSRRPTGCLLTKSRLRSLPQLPSPPTFDKWLTGWVERARTDLAGNEPAKRED